MSDADQAGAGRREVAFRVFAAEYDDATLDHTESDEERAPNYVVTPTGARVNRLFLVGVLTEIEPVSDEVLRARVVDPTGAFVVYAGQYQPDALAFLERTEPPMFVAVTGKARTFEPDDGDQVYTSVRPESINEVDAETRDRWVVNAAEHTLSRVGTFARALQSGERGEALQRALAAAGVDEGLASGVPLALDHYGTTPAYLAAVRDLALDAARVVAGERDEAEPLSVAPDAAGDADLDALTDAHAPFDELAVEEPAAATPGATDDGAEPSGADRAAAGTGGATETDDDGRLDDFDGGDLDDEAEADETAESTPDEATADEAADEEDDQVVDDASDVEEADASDDVDGEDAEPQDVASDEMYELDEEEREQIEEEYGTEFSTAAEVDDPGEADIDVPDAAEVAAEGDADAAEDAGTDEGDAAESDDADEEPDVSEETEEAAGTPEEAEETDLEDAVMETMRELDEGDGADREEVVAAVVEKHGVTPDEVEDAIQDALMDGRCYEPGEATLKPI